MSCTIRLLVFLLIISGGYSYSYAQEKVLLLSGKEIEGEKVEKDSVDVRITRTKKKKKKFTFYDQSRVFSITKADGTTEILYFQDTTDENALSIREMQYYIVGEQDAMKSYKAPLALIGGFVITAVATYQWGPYIGLIPVIPITLGMAMISPKIKRKAVSNPDLLREDTYIMGHRRKAKNIKVQRVITGAIGGFVVGILTATIVTNIN
ncbi:MAG TPA: hypothetical protein EYN38_06520 [Flavobacteriales bacterium]|nr:hypothetical protein [Flavobacteriales bacterium]